METTGTGRNSALRYKTFNSLLSDVRADFFNYALENLIDPAPLVRVAQKCNYDLGLLIYQTKETILDLDKGRVRLPDAFHSVDYAFLCGQHTETRILPQGTHIEERMVVPQYHSVPAHLDSCQTPIICSNCHLVPCGCNTYVSPTPLCSCGGGNICEGAVYNPLEPQGDFYKKPRVFLDCKGDCVELVQYVNTERRHYNHVIPLRFKSNSEGIDERCLGMHFRSEHDAWIKDGFLFTNYNRGHERDHGCGKVYIRYQSEMEDADGNLLVPDHPILIAYYEAALKQKICEQLFMQGEDVAQKLQYWEEKRKLEKGAAKSIVNLPNFEEMRELHRQNRRAQWDRFYRDFSSRSWFDGRGYFGDSFTGRGW
jgi:hypothetical protein